MVIDGKMGPKYDKILLPVFSPDSSHLSYMVQKEKKWKIVIDEKEKKLAYDFITNPIYSPNSKHLCYMAKKNDSWGIVIDDKESVYYDGLAIPTFSPDAKYLAYAALKDHKWFIVIDDMKGNRFESTRFTGVVKGTTILFDGPNRLRVLAFNDDPNFQILKVEIDVE